MKMLACSLKGVLFQGEAEKVVAKTTTGEITVLDNHLPLITVLARGVLKITDEKREDHFFPVESGFLEVRYDNGVRCIIE